MHTISDFMTTYPCTVSADLTLADAQDRMAANNIRHLLVERAGRLVGLLSSRDVALAGSMGLEPTRSSVVEAMSGEVFTCPPDADLVDVAREMEHHRFGCAVVVDHDFVVGVFTTTDALRALRQALLGTAVRAEVRPTHHERIDGPRELAIHHFRIGDSLRSHGASPRATQGTFR